MQPSTSALLTSAPTDNLAIALGSVSRAQWLQQIDVANQATFEAFLARGRYLEACEFLLGHLQRTEVTRTRVQGPGPSWADAVDAFHCAVDRQAPEQMQLIHLFVVGGVNATPASVACQGTGDEGRPHSAAPTAGSCAPDAPTLAPVHGPLCGHVDERTGLVCCTDAHPRNPGAHFYRSNRAAAETRED